MDQWKAFEAYSASLFGTTRAWANSGERLDFPPSKDRGTSPVIGQCKNVQRMSLHELSTLAHEVETLANEGAQVGVVCIKSRQGRGKYSPTLVVMTDRMWVRLVEQDGLIRQIQEQRKGKIYGDDSISAKADQEG